MNKLTLSLLLLLILIHPVAPFVQALDDDPLTDEELELVNYVSYSYIQLLQMNSIHVDGMQAIEFLIDAGGVRITQSSLADMDVNLLLEDSQAVAYSILADQFVSVISEPGVSTDYNMSMELRLIDDVVYLRVYNLPLELRNFFPDGWINLNDGIETFPGMEVLRADQLIGMTRNTGLGNYYTRRTVLNIEELPEETLENGIATRVFAVEVDPVQAFRGYEDYWMNLLSLRAIGVTLYDFNHHILPAMTYNGIIRIDSETDLLAQSEVEMAMEAEVRLGNVPVDLSITLQVSFDYSDFNEEVDIVVPNVGDF